MIKSYLREMNKLSRILSIMLCFMPFAYASAGPVATTSGSNLTAFNPSNAMNNQWATMSNGRYGSSTSAKADFGNCNSLVLRCAQPKCSNGGCSDMSVASAIVAGCVQSNKSCAQYGNDLVQYMSAQLVASSNAKINEQNAAAQAAAAQAAQEAAAQQSELQAQQMQQMQMQMQQMQQQMAQQQAESAQQLQSALAQQAEQSAAAIENMRSAATEAAMKTESGLTSYEQEAIQRGISEDVLERKKITGQIMTEIENSEASLQEVKVALNAAFDYAKCDARGNNCEGPKRVKKWRELATVFLTPYDNAIDKLYDALELAQLVGVDLSDIYMMLNNSCNRWGQYMCPKMEGGQVVYHDEKTPEVCPKDYYDKLNETEYANCVKDAIGDKAKETTKAERENIEANCKLLHTSRTGKDSKDCRPCSLLKILPNGEEVYEGWVYGDQDTTANTTVVACASGALDSSKLFTRRTKNKNGAGLVDIDQMDVWLNQKEPARKTRNGADPWDYCNAEGYEEILEKSMLSKTAPEKGYALCVGDIESGKLDFKLEDKNCGYISPIYAICDAHVYNRGKKTAEEASTVKANGEVDSSNCTKKATAEDSGYLYKDHIVWAKENDEKECIVQLCSPGWAPNVSSDKKGCEKLEEKDTKYKSWQKDGDEYKKAEARWRSEVMAGFSETKEMIALKTTVISQQMYKQYEYLNATIRRLKTQLEKAVYKSQLEAAGAKSEDGSSSSALLGSSSRKSSQYRDCSGKSKQGTLDCLRENYTALKTQVNGKKCTKDDKTQMKTDIDILESVMDDAKKLIRTHCEKLNNIEDCKNCLNLDYSGGMSKLETEIRNESKTPYRFGG